MIPAHILNQVLTYTESRALWHRWISRATQFEPNHQQFLFSALYCDFLKITRKCCQPSYGFGMECELWEASDQRRGRFALRYRRKGDWTHCKLRCFSKWAQLLESADSNFIGLCSQHFDFMQFWTNCSYFLFMMCLLNDSCSMSMA